MGLAETYELIDKSLSFDFASFDFAQDKINIGLFGFGCVGQGLYDVLNYSQGLRANIGKICVKDRGKKRRLNNDCFTFERNVVLENENHNLIVELINDSDAALEIISTALKSGKDVVTANKKTIAENYEYLYKLQMITGSSLLYEGACGGSIPILRTLEEYYDNELLKSIRGILNGSTNYILTKMELENCSFHEAVKQAQGLGFAEREPWLDVAGYDTKYKLCLLAAHGFGLILKPENILNSGIQNISEFDINYAKEKNLRIKLVANIERLESSWSLESLESLESLGSSASLESSGSLCNGRKEKKYRIYVLPRFIPRNEQLANVNYEYNGIEVEGIFSDRQFFSGKGAGSHPTGSAVLSDISAITYGYKYGYKKLKKRINGKPVNNGIQYFKDDNKFIDDNFTIKVYIRYKTQAELNKLEIYEIEEEYKSHNHCYVIAKVKFSSLRGILNSKEVFVAVI
jgi:homoserine dehydrogenase